MKDKESKVEEFEVSHTLGGPVTHTEIRQSLGRRQTMPVWVAITMHLCTCVSEEGGDGESTGSEEISLLSYTLRYVSLTDLRECDG